MEFIHAYAAGLMDGEGTITLTKSKKKARRRPHVSLSSTTIELVELFKKYYGGTIVSHKVYKAHHKPNWSWRVEYDRALDFLKLVLPYMHEPEKVRRGSLLLDKYKSVTVRNGRYSEEQLLKKEAFEQEFFSKNVSRLCALQPTNPQL